MDLVRPDDTAADLAATLLYPVTDRPFRELYELAQLARRTAARKSWTSPCASRRDRDEMLREFRGGLFDYDMVMDIGAYRDLHRHRRCQQFRQAFRSRLGSPTPKAIGEAGAPRSMSPRCAKLAVAASLPAPGAQYLLPFAVRSRFLFKMDFAEAEYISRLRSGVKGHFSYRDIAWQMKLKMGNGTRTGRLIEATPPWMEDPLRR